ncbi:hypothetical protein C5L22_10295 [Pantoea ananatis]|nr:hypothetical protein C5L22_10295 [Pantoea ananatis]
MAAFFVSAILILKPQTSNLKPQTSNLKPQTSNLKPQTSNLKPQTSNLKPQTLTPSCTRRVASAFFVSEQC